MKALPPSDLIEATRLTRAGRLNEAVALLQGMLRGSLPSDVAESSAPPTAIALPQPVLDLKPVSGDGISDSHTGYAGILPQEVAFGGVLNRLDLNGLDLKGLGLRGVPRRRIPAASEIAPPGGTFIAKSFSNEAGRRSYKLYIPSRCGDEPRPLIVMLHGCTQSADDFAAGTPPKSTHVLSSIQSSP